MVSRFKDYVVFAKNAVIRHPKYKQRFTPSEEEVRGGLQLLEAFLDKRTKLQDLSEYRAQIFGYVNENGERVLWVNCFSNPYFDKYWKDTVINVMDGGNSFFEVEVNLDTKEVFNLYVHGGA